MQSLNIGPPENWDPSEWLAVSTRSRDFLVENYKIYQELEDILKLDPVLAGVIARYGGLGKFITTDNPDWLTNISYLYFLIFQICVASSEGNRVTQTLPKRLDEISKSMEDRDKALREYFDDKIQKAVRDLQEGAKADVTNIEVTIKNEITNRFETLINNITEVKQTVLSVEINLKAEFNAQFNNFFTQVIAKFDAFIVLFNSKINEVTSLINNRHELVIAAVTRVETNLTTTFNRAFFTLNAHLETLMQFATNTTGSLMQISANIGLINTAIDSTLALCVGVEASLALLAGDFTAFAESASLVFVELLTVTGATGITVGRIDEIVYEFPTTLKQDLDQLEKDLREHVCEDCSELTAAKIVGTTYYRWDLDTNYAPTVVFIFNEIGSSPDKRQTQIKGKLPFTTATLPNNIVEILRNRVQTQGPFGYYKGNFRANFVHPSDKWKTTIFVKEKQDALNVLKAISFILGIPQRPDGLSFTEPRSHFTSSKLQHNLPEILARNDDPSETFKVILTRVVLLVNNSKQPNVIWKS